MHICKHPQVVSTSANQGRDLPHTTEAGHTLPMEACVPEHMRYQIMNECCLGKLLLAMALPWRCCRVSDLYNLRHCRKYSSKVTGSAPSRQAHLCPEESTLMLQ